VLLFYIVFLIGIPKLLPVIGEVQEDMPAYGILKEGDKVLAINGNKIEYWDDMSDYIKKNADKLLILDIERGGKQITVRNYSQNSVKMPNIFGEKMTVGLIGITLKVK